MKQKTVQVISRRLTPVVRRMGEETDFCPAKGDCPVVRGSCSNCWRNYLTGKKPWWVFNIHHVRAESTHKDCARPTISVWDEPRAKVLRVSAYCPWMEGKP